MTESSHTESLVIRRTVPATPEVVWSMWTEPEHFAAWYGPAGAVVEVLSMDVRVGGSRRIGMSITTPEGSRQMWFAGEHLEVDPVTLLAYTEAMADRDGVPLSPGGAGHAVSTTVRVDLEAEGDATRMVVTHVGIAPDSPGATGWAMAIDKLTEHLAGRRA